MSSEPTPIDTPFSLGHAVTFFPGPCDVPKAVLIHPETGDRVEILLYGAHLTSWKTRNGDEIIFMSKKAVFEKTKAIRGGVPVIFPQFGPGKIQNHGFARNVPWEIVGSKVENGNVHLTLGLHENPFTLNIWPFPFYLELEFILSAPHTLNIRFRVQNTGKQEFGFQTALHTYYKISNIANVSVRGLSGLEYIDKTKGAQKFREDKDVITIQQEVDSVYCNVPEDKVIDIVDKGGNTLHLKSASLPEVVVWNPWIEKAKSLADLGDEEYHEFICVEAGTIATPHTLIPSADHESFHTITITPSSSL
eukprot:TRINITY_DN894_c0_g1_i1.p1 TRINITY_DN894_c0_g1~~TRINITY_DN894_c0_g1_i1.p1  ORF type:complete len:306 (+),score=44.83 TRINITY_DN894_c0_g1_i1:252-1169(+)